MTSCGQQDRNAARHQSGPARGKGRSSVHQMQVESTGQGGGGKPDVAVARRRQAQHEAGELNQGTDGDQCRGDAETDRAVAKPAPLALHDARQQPPKPHPAGADSQHDRHQRHNAYGKIARCTQPRAVYQLRGACHAGNGRDPAGSACQRRGRQPIWSFRAQGLMRSTHPQPRASDLQRVVGKLQPPRIAPALAAYDQPIDGPEVAREHPAVVRNLHACVQRRGVRIVQRYVGLDAAPDGERPPVLVQG
jgi:hypothetical protein